MATVTSGELYRDFGTIMERVFKGEVILVTRYGRPYAQLVPPELTLPKEDRRPPSE